MSVGKYNTEAKLKNLAKKIELGSRFVEIF